MYNNHSDCEKVKQKLYRPRLHMKVVRHQPYAPAVFNPRKYFQHKFLLEAQGHSAAGKITPPRIESAIFRLEAQCLN